MPSSETERGILDVETFLFFFRHQQCFVSQAEVEGAWVIAVLKNIQSFVSVLILAYLSQT